MFLLSFDLGPRGEEKKTRGKKSKKTHPPRRGLQVQRRVQRPDHPAVPVWERVLDVVKRRVEQRVPSGVPGGGLDPDGLVDRDGAAEL